MKLGHSTKYNSGSSNLRCELLNETSEPLVQQQGLCIGPDLFLASAPWARALTRRRSARVLPARPSLRVLRPARRLDAQTLEWSIFYVVGFEWRMGARVAMVKHRAHHVMIATAYQTLAEQQTKNLIMLSYASKTRQRKITCMINL